MSFLANCSVSAQRPAQVRPGSTPPPQGESVPRTGVDAFDDQIAKSHLSVPFCLISLYRILFFPHAFHFHSFHAFQDIETKEGTNILWQLLPEIFIHIFFPVDTLGWKSFRPPFQAQDVAVRQGEKMNPESHLQVPDTKSYWGPWPYISLRTGGAAGLGPEVWAGHLPFATGFPKGPGPSLDSHSHKLLLPHLHPQTPPPCLPCWACPARRGSCWASPARLPSGRR